MMTLPELTRGWRTLMTEFQTPMARKAVAGEVLTHFGSALVELGLQDGARIERLGFEFLGEVAAGKSA